MHWLVGTPLVNLCAIGWPLWSLRMVGSGLSAAVVPRLPWTWYGPLCTGDRSLAYTTWHAVHPLDR